MAMILTGYVIQNDNFVTLHKLKNRLRHACLLFYVIPIYKLFPPFQLINRLFNANW
jgi:hypothetical protein